MRRKWLARVKEGSLRMVLIILVLFVVGHVFLSSLLLHFRSGSLAIRPVFNKSSAAYLNTTVVPYRFTNVKFNPSDDLSTTKRPKLIYDVYEEQPENLPICPQLQKITGPITPSTLKVSKVDISWRQLGQLYANTSLETSGLWRPSKCRSSQSVAIVVPYRQRDKHLRQFLRHIHPILQRQKLDYGIFVVEQLEGSKFNRASLFNIGFLEALKVHNFTCFIFHDVDLLPEDARYPYNCGPNPYHFSTFIDKFKYKLPYKDLFGGVSAISREQFEHINGFSNLYFGWGGEDDDIFGRLASHGFQIEHLPYRYTSLSHNAATKNRYRNELLKNSNKRHSVDGIKSTFYTIRGAYPEKFTFWIRASISEKLIKKMYADFFKKEPTILQDFVDTPISSIVVLGVYLFVAAAFCLAIVVCICHEM